MDKKDLFEPRIVTDNNENVNEAKKVIDFDEYKKEESEPVEKKFFDNDFKPESTNDNEHNNIDNHDHESNNFNNNNHNNNFNYGNFENEVQEPNNEVPEKKEFDFKNDEPIKQEEVVNNTEMNSTPVVETTKKGGNVGLLWGALALILVVGGVLIYFIMFRNTEVTLECSGGDVLSSEEVSLTFKNGRYSFGKLSGTVDLESIAQAYGVSLDDIDINELKFCDSLGTGTQYYRYLNCKEKVNGNKLSMEVDLDIYAKSEKVDIDDLKKELEEEGYTCKKK